MVSGGVAVVVSPAEGVVVLVPGSVVVVGEVDVLVCSAVVVGGAATLVVGSGGSGGAGCCWSTGSPAGVVGTGSATVVPGVAGGSDGTTGIE
ncbi:hypothetical protein NLM24_26510 [Nocardia zapadnayensis]|nr:hypothetical protein [Nocardia zapadnayensis]MCX0274179.1 hypothetical protein [Nocardia zapadnayensis]